MKTINKLSSLELIKQAENVIPGGVNSPVRAFGSVGGSPVFISHGEGAYVYDYDGNRFIDYVGSWGPLILGHADNDVLKEVIATAHKGLSFGAPTEVEIKLAEKIISLMPNIEKVRMVNSGTEATMSALRLARGYTNKDKIIKFTGCYHGHSDSLLVKAGSGLMTLSASEGKAPTAASSAGVPDGVVQDTLVAEFNNLESVAELFENHKDNIAAIILEPIPGNMNMVLPQKEFLEGLRELCDKYNSLLIFDEVMTGFRVALGGAQSIYNIKPDLTTLGKVIGGGMPVGAFGGRKDIMDCLAPLGNVYQAGTLSGNPIAMTAGLVTLNKISQPGFFENLSAKTALLVNSISEVMQAHNIPFIANHMGGMFGMFFTKDKNITKINNFSEVVACDTHYFNRFFHAMLDKGVYLAPSAFEAGFVSSVHTQTIIAQTVEAAERAVSIK